MKKLHPLKAVLWDLDGTLLDTLDDLTAAVNVALCAYRYAPRTRAEVQQFVGDGVEKLVRRSLPAGVDETTVGAVLDAFRTYYSAHNADKTTPYAGIPEVLTDLRRQGIRMAVVSNKPESVAEMLRGRFFADTVSLALGDRPDRPRKPAPDGVWEALRRIDIPASQALYVGDSDVDILTAERAGVDCLSVGWGFRDAEFLRRSGAKEIAETPEKVLEYIRKRA